ncbi:MAG: glycosyltransferase family 39 protein [archaeon]|nr:glycosyltransferase family 39 protein [archaeon]
MRRQTKILIAIFILALIVRLIFTFSTPLRWWDETVYANLGYELSKNPLGYSFAYEWSDFVPSGGDNLYAWPKAGFRAPLLPYFLSLFYLIGLDFLIIFLMPFFGALSSVFIYFLSRKLFNEKVGIYSAIFWSLIPLSVYYSGKILTDVFVTFFVIIIFLCFWKGYEENKNLYKILFGIFLALGLLARYTILWIMPVFLIYFLIRDKSLKFLKDKYLWYSILIFFIILTPWFIYGYLDYGNPFGAFIHGIKAASYWGGTQPWYYLLTYWWNMFSIIGFVFLISFLYILYKKEFLKKEIYLLLIWIFFFLLMSMLMPHKEDRFLLPIVPALCILSGFVIDKITVYKKWILSVLIIILILSLSVQFYYTYRDSYTPSNLCFLQGNNFLKDVENNSLIITDESPITYYYTKKDTGFHNNPINLSTLKSWKERYKDRPIYAILTDFDSSYVKDAKMREDLDSNFEKVFDCSNHTIIYRVG